MAHLISDLKIGFRVLLKTPGISAIALLSLALGIGANAAIFSIFNFLFLHPLPHVKDTEQILKVYDTTPWDDYGSISYPDYLDYRRAPQAFSDFIAYGADTASLDLGGMPERIRVEMVTGNYFPFLGVQPAVGRFFSSADDHPGAAPVVVLSHGLWQRAFGSDPAAVGKSLRLNGNSFQIVGVAPARFRGLDLGATSELWAPLAKAPQIMSQGPAVIEERGYALWNLAARLKPGARQEQGAARLTAVAQHLNQQFPGRYSRSPRLVPAIDATFSPGSRGTVSGFVGLLMAVVGLVLLIACINIANLMLARTARRQRELSVRQALGADRSRLVWQLLTESLLLALLGAALGLALAVVLLPILGRFHLPAEIALDLSLDGRVIAFTLLLALLTGLLVGLVPALRASRPDLVSTLKDTGTGLQPGRLRLGLRSLFVVAQVALSLLLLIGAGLFLRSLQRLQAIDPGVAAENLAMVSLDLGAAGYSEERGRAFYQQLVERVGSLPGVTSATVASSLPIQSDFSSIPFFSDEIAEAKEGKRISVNLVGPGYFRTIGLTLLQGRDFSRADTGPPSVCVINQTLAERFWPGQSALGRRLRFSNANGALLEVIGIAQAGKYSSLREDPKPFIYLPYGQVYELFSTTKHLLVRTSGEPGSLFADIRREVQALDRNLPVFNARTMEGHLATFLIRERQTAVLLLLLSLLALLLASIGLYGVMSYSVSQRTREIGIRMAMGAERGTVLKQMITESARLIAIGSVIGLVAALVATRLISSLLYSVSPTDTTTFAVAFAVLALVGIVAGFFPARRAASVNPMTAIRYD